MRGRFAAFLFLLAACVPASAGTMNAHGHCRVVAGEKLLAGSGGASAICSEVERAVKAAAPRANYTADVKVLSRSRLAATLVVNGRKLAEQHFAVMDRDLNPGSIRRFAQSLADEVARVAKH